MGLNWHSATFVAISVLVVICSLQTGNVDAGCPSGFKTCGKNPRKPCLTSTKTDAKNCGCCGVKCPTRPNSTPVCSNGSCNYHCNKNFHDCDGQSSNGCETTSLQLQTSSLNCGKCGTKCPARANAIPTCVNGRCSARCNPGWKDCNNNMTRDGCETFVAGSDPANCGQCGATCRVDQFPNGVFQCSAGKCGLVWCYTGTADCNGVLADGCESIVVYNPLNCGGCGLVCPRFRTPSQCAEARSAMRFARRASATAMAPWLTSAVARRSTSLVTATTAGRATWCALPELVVKEEPVSDSRPGAGRTSTLGTLATN